VRILRETYSRMEPQSDRALAQMTANYFGEIAFIDDGVGKILSALKQRGLDDSTMVVFTSDHGDFLGDHGLYLKGPMPYDGCLRVGLIVSGPGIPGNRVVDSPVSTVDLAETFYDWTGLGSTAKPHTQGQSLTDVLGSPLASRNAAYSEWHLDDKRCGVALKLQTVRTRDAKMTVELNSGAGELYDLSDDPQEMVNRFDDPASRALRDTMVELLEGRPQSSTLARH